MAMACVSECEMETLISFRPTFLAAAAASPWSCANISIRS